MKCQKCAKPAIVHLTEVITDSGGAKRAVEIHLCLSHATEAGLVAPGSEILPQIISGKPNWPASQKAENASSEESEMGIIPLPQPAESGLTVARDKNQPAADPAACPLCGLNWNNFKQAGLLGCPHDYDLFAAKLLPLLKRAQEGASEHAGKVPSKKKTQEGDRQITTTRLRRDLQKALDAENYEQAASLRDKLKDLERN